MLGKETAPRWLCFDESFSEVLLQYPLSVPQTPQLSPLLDGAAREGPGASGEWVGDLVATLTLPWHQDNGGGCREAPEGGLSRQRQG